MNLITIWIEFELVASRIMEFEWDNDDFVVADVVDVDDSGWEEEVNVNVNKVDNNDDFDEETNDDNDGVVDETGEDYIVLLFVSLMLESTQVKIVPLVLLLCEVILKW